MKAQKIWFENGRIFLTTDDGRTGSLLLRAFPRLARASDEQRMKYELSRSGIHWPELDEDLSFEGFFDQPAETSDNRVAMAFAQFPEINVRQRARRMGINETLLAKYICGYSKPSEKRAKEIEAALHDLGHKLTQISI